MDQTVHNLLENVNRQVVRMQKEDADAGGS